MLNIISTTNPELEIAKETASVINAQLAENKKVLWLLAGGSAVNYYKLMGELFTESLDFANLTIALGDERYDKNPNHDTATWPVLKELEVFQNLERSGAKVYHILTGDTLKADVERFNQFLGQDFDFVVCSLGIGSDGHTAGIIPITSRELFEEVYTNNDALAVGHEHGGKHPKRITITPKMITQVDRILAYAVGEDKKSTLQTLAKFDKSYPGAEWESQLHNYPALYITVKDGEIYTGN